MIRKTPIAVIFFAIILLFAGSCSHRYYSNYNGKVTKGFRKPPREIKGSPARNFSFRGKRSQRER